jgi:UDP-galactopyranose mutase
VKIFPTFKAVSSIRRKILIKYFLFFFYLFLAFVTFLKINGKKNMNFFQPASVVNYPNPIYPFTRIVEYKHFLNQKSNDTIIVSETTKDKGHPFYPVPSKRNLELYVKNDYDLNMIG